MASQERDIIVGIRFNKTERLKLQIQAEKMGMAISSFVRLILKKKKII